MAKDFWSRVKKTKSCWDYVGTKNVDGYGWARHMGKNMGAHRYSWILSNGNIPDGLHVLHKCDNPSCVKPAHLYLGTHQKNMRDRADRRRCKHQKLSRGDVSKIKEMRKMGATCQQIADKFGISNGHASEIARGIYYVNG